MNKISFHQNTDDVPNYQNVVQRQFTRGTLHPNQKEDKNALNGIGRE